MGRGGATPPLAGGRVTFTLSDLTGTACGYVLHRKRDWRRRWRAEAPPGEQLGIDVRLATRPRIRACRRPPVLRAGAAGIATARPASDTPLPPECRHRPHRVDGRLRSGWCY